MGWLRWCLVVAPLFSAPFLGGCGGEAVQQQVEDDLFSAVKAGDARAIDMRLRRGDDVDARNAEGKTPLHLAAEMGNTLIIEWLITEGQANPNVRDAQGRTPMEVAQAAGHAEAAQFLAARGSGT